MRYAADTQVSEQRTRNEIETLLGRYGATAFGYASTPDRSQVAFRMRGRSIRFYLPMPKATDRAISHVSTGRGNSKARSPSGIAAAIAKANRQRWRALLLIIRAKLEAIESGIVSLEEEFLAHTILPNGETVAEHLGPMMALAHERGEMPPQLMLENRK